MADEKGDTGAKTPAPEKGPADGLDLKISVPQGGSKANEKAGPTTLTNEPCTGNVEGPDQGGGDPKKKTGPTTCDDNKPCAPAPPGPDKGGGGKDTPAKGNPGGKFGDLGKD